MTDRPVPPECVLHSSTLEQIATAVDRLDRTIRGANGDLGLLGEVRIMANTLNGHTERIERLEGTPLTVRDTLMQRLDELESNMRTGSRWLSDRNLVAVLALVLAVILAKVLEVPLPWLD